MALPKNIGETLARLEARLVERVAGRVEELGLFLRSRS